MDESVFALQENRPGLLQQFLDVNGELLTPTDDVSEPYPNPYPSMLGKPDEMRAWTVSPALLRDGPNKLEFALASGPRLTLAYLDLAMPAGGIGASEK